MTRRIIPSTDGPQFKAGAAAPQAKADEYKDRLLKYIPAEVIALYTTAMGIAASAGTAVSQNTMQWAIFLAVLILTPLYIARISREPDMPLATGQITVSTGSYVVWVFALGGPFATLPWYKPVYGSLLLVFYTFVVPIVFKGDRS